MTNRTNSRTRVDPYSVVVRYVPASTIDTCVNDTHVSLNDLQRQRGRLCRLPVWNVETIVGMLFIVNSKAFASRLLDPERQAWGEPAL